MEPEPKMTKETGNKYLIGIGAAGFALCLAGVVYGTTPFVLGLLLIVLAAIGSYQINKKI